MQKKDRSLNQTPVLKTQYDFLNEISPTFCAAKWLNLTLWLHKGTTSSCHHPPAYKIDPTLLKKGYDQLHNTPNKILARKQMLAGERPRECNYCWKIEDLGQQFTSDRVFKSEIYSSHVISQLTQTKNLENILPKTLEVAFDNNCDFACSYCNQHFSTKWGSDLKKNGPFHLLKSGWVLSQGEPLEKIPANPYLDAFWAWWPTLKKNLQEIRITGGEPLLSKYTWKLLEDLTENQEPNLRVAINSNLGCSPQTLDRLIKYSQTIAHLDIYTSNESVGQYTEYIRDGISWKTWSSNIRTLSNSASVQTIHVMMTISALTLEGTPDFIEYFVKLRQEFQTQQFCLTLNILRMPNFQNVLVLPSNLRSSINKKLSLTLNRFRKSLLNIEIEHIERLIAYLNQEFTSPNPNYTESDLQKDLRLFIKQYDQRRNKDHKLIFSSSLCNWLKAPT